MKATAPGGRPRLHVVYYALAAFDLLTVLLSLHLFGLIADIHSDSVATNQVWAARLEDYAELSRLASAVNTPGNDIFTSRDAQAEAARLTHASKRYSEKFQAVRDDLGAHVEPADATGLLATCDAVDTSMAELLAAAHETFEYFRREQTAEAAARMAAMDRHHSQVNSTLSKLGAQVRAIQKRHLDNQMEQATVLRRGERLIAGLIAMMVLCVTVYGHKLTRRMKAVARETASHVAELASYRQHLETQVHERTAELQASHERLRLTERMASIGTLAAGLGHDMDNALFTIRCRLDAMQSRDDGDSRLGGELAEVRQSLDYLQQLSDGLRLVALDPVDTEASGAVTDIAAMWIEVHGLYAAQLPRSARLESQLPPGLPPVSIAPHQLSQVLFNLVGNAGEALDEGGRVLVTAEVVDDGRLVRLAVADDGHGMTPDVARQALDPFFTTKTRGLSTGLGMSLAQGIVRSAGGELAIDSRVGRGTTVSLLLPVAERPVSPRPPTGEGDPDRSASISLQDRRLATFVSALLRAEGFDVRFSAPDAPPTGSLWVADALDDHLERARAFRGADPSHRIMLFGQASPAWSGIDALSVNPTGDLQAIREAINAMTHALDAAGR